MTTIPDPAITHPRWCAPNIDHHPDGTDDVCHESVPDILVTTDTEMAGVLVQTDEPWTRRPGSQELTVNIKDTILTGVPDMRFCLTREDIPRVAEWLMRLYWRMAP